MPSPSSDSGTISQNQPQVSAIPYIPNPALTAAVAAAEPKPLVPGWLMKAAAAVVPLALLANHSLPAPFNTYAAIVGAVAAFLACLAMPAFTFSAPLIPLSLVPVALSVGGWLMTLAPAVTSPLAHGAVVLAGTLCFALAGKALPAPQVPSAPQ